MEAFIGMGLFAGLSFLGFFIGNAIETRARLSFQTHEMMVNEVWKPLRRELEKLNKAYMRELS